MRGQRVIGGLTLVMACGSAWRTAHPARAGLVRGRALVRQWSAATGASSNQPQRPQVDPRLSLAPMMEYTDRHFRFLLRLMSSKMVLYSEMVAAATLHYNAESRERLLCLSGEEEHPVVLQLGGSDPGMMAKACTHAAPYNYDEINVNCGCPSEKVAGAGCFGAALMREPDLVARICSEMSEAVDNRIPITVKCRIGVDNDDSYEQLHSFVDRVASKAGVSHFVIHARKALLNGISPQANRKIPPLKYDFVYRLVQDFPQLTFTLNGGVLSFEDVECHLSHGVHGVMIGRAITARPFYWANTDRRIYGVENPGLNRRQILEKYMDYADGEEQLAGPRVRRLLAKHVHHLFAGEANGRRFRAALDQGLLTPHMTFRQILTSALEVIPEDTLVVPPGSDRIAAPDKVRH